MGAQPDGSRKYHIITFGITAIASMGMATGHGVYIREFDGREFFYARYVDWAFTTPLQLLDICGFAGASNDQTLWLLGMCMFMPILSALLGGLKASAATKSAAVQGVFKKIAPLTAISWAAYPVVWLAAEGSGKITADQEAMAYTFLDIIAKSVFGFIIVSARDACNEV